MLFGMAKFLYERLHKVRLWIIAFLCLTLNELALHKSVEMNSARMAWKRRGFRPHSTQWSIGALISDTLVCPAQNS